MRGDPEAIEADGEQAILLGARLSNTSFPKLASRSTWLNGSTKADPAQRYATVASNRDRCRPAVSIPAVQQEDFVARHVVVQVLCDICESADGTSSNEFSIERGTYEIDLCSMHQAAFDDALNPFVDRARAVSRGRSASATNRAVTRRDPGQTEAIRRWARDNGFAISSRGRIPASIEQSYNARLTS